MPTFQPRMAEYSRILVLEGRCNTGIHSVDVFGPGRGKNRKLGAEIRLSRCTKVRERDYRSESSSPVCRKGEERCNRFTGPGGLGRNCAIRIGRGEWTRPTAASEASGLIVDQR